MTAAGQLSGQVAIVTGATGGLGRAVCSQLAEAGATVIGFDLAATADVAVDVSDLTAVEDAVERAAPEGRVDVLVTCAGIALMAGFETTTSEDFNRVLAVNAGGTFNLLRTVLPLMKRRQYGRVVTIASIAADFGYPFPAYGASKAAVVALTRSAAVQYARDGVSVNCVSPGRIATPMAPTEGTELGDRIPAGHAAEPVDVARVVRLLCLPDAGYVNGANIVCDGGMSSVFAMHGFGPYLELMHTMSRTKDR